MKVVIKPSSVNGIVIAPTSKSSMQRACAAALLHQGETIIYNPGKSNDDLAALDIIQKLGAVIIENSNQKIVINSKGVRLKATEINCGESGLSIRMFAPIAALSNSPVTITGTGSLLNRPMNFFDEIFPQLGIAIESNNGMLPLKIKGSLLPKNITINGSLSSQFLTGLLLAFAKAATETITITVNNLKSKPYIDLTVQVMQHFGYNVTNNNYQSFTIKPASHLPSNINYTVEGDWSGAAFLLVAGAIAGNIIVQGLDKNSTQADKKIMDALADCGCNIVINDTEIKITHSDESLTSFNFDATDCPDLFPPLVALAAYCKGTTTIKGVHRLEHKESNRALTLQQEFAKMGVEIILQDDWMRVKGGGGLKGAKVHSHHDHRIAMACAVAALKAKGPTEIEEAEAINKSYPNFYEHLKTLSAPIFVTN